MGALPYTFIAFIEYCLIEEPRNFIPAEISTFTMARNANNMHKNIKQDVNKLLLYTYN